MIFLHLKVSSSSQLDRETATHRVQTWWRKITRRKSNLTRQRKAVEIIEAWWIGTSVKRKIARALEQAYKNDKDFEIEDFDFATMTSELDEIAAKLENEKVIAHVSHKTMPKSTLRPIVQESKSLNNNEPKIVHEMKARNLSYKRHDGHLGTEF